MTLMLQSVKQAVLQVVNSQVTATLTENKHFKEVVSHLCSVWSQNEDILIENLSSKVDVAVLQYNCENNGLRWLYYSFKCFSPSVVHSEEPLLIRCRYM